MNLTWIGAIFIVAGCTGCGFSAAAAGKREARILQELLTAVRFMESELQYKLSTLPDLCRHTGNVSAGVIREIFWNLARELDWQAEPDAAGCMVEALEKSHSLPQNVRLLFLQLGASLGQFDLSGQLKELEHVRASCENALQASLENQEPRLRSYRTLGICTGAALAILLL